jgi:hypothetical protein
MDDRKKLPTRIQTRLRDVASAPGQIITHEAELVLLAQAFSMRIVWLIPLTVFVLGAGAYYRARRRGSNATPLTSEPVSGQWLAEARGREEQHW